MNKLLLLLFFLTFTGNVFAQKLTGVPVIDSVLVDRDQYWDNFFTEEEREENPLGINTKKVFADAYEFNKQLLAKLTLEVDPDTLSFDDYISWELLRFDLDEDLKSYEFREYLNPIMSESGFHTRVLWRVNRPYRTKEQLENYLIWLKDLPRYFDEHIALMTEGIEIGFTQPLDGLQNYGATYDPYIVDNPEESAFYAPFSNKPSDMSQDEWEIMESTAKEYVDKYVTQSYIKVKEFFEDEYFPGSRKGLGASTIPDGREFYEFKVRYYTTLDVTPDEVHEMGLKEVARIRKEMEAIIQDVGFEGSFEDFLSFLRTDPQFFPETPEDLLKEASFIAKKVDGRLPSLFGKLPRQPYGVVPVPAYLAENYTGGRYSSAPLDSDRGGEYWVNTTKLKSRTLYTLPALTLHEAMPGHHLQIALTAEMEELPTFRRNTYVNAFGEGWGLYAEFLGHELDIYETPYDLFGRYTYEMWRACRLVIDTGIHWKGWSRDEAVEYLAENSALSIHEVNTEINRYITWPGQALAYKIGEMTIKRLRNEAEEALGDNFDVKEFHDVVLSKGTVTMSILEEITDRYVEQKLAEIEKTES